MNHVAYIKRRQKDSMLYSIEYLSLRVDIVIFFHIFNLAYWTIIKAYIYVFIVNHITPEQQDKL